MKGNNYTFWSTKETIQQRPLHTLLTGPAIGAAAGTALAVGIGLALVATAVIAFPVLPFICAGLAIVGALIGMLIAIKMVKNRNKMYHPIAQPKSDNPWGDDDEKDCSPT